MDIQSLINTMEYRKLEQRKHYLHRPDMYVGSIEPETHEDYVPNEEAKMEKREITYIPALERLFVEAMSNVIDNYWRSVSNGIDCSTIKVVAEQETGLTSIWNDGMWIPIEKNSEDVWIPHMIFGEFLTSSNYDDTEERYTSGRNGVGVKAVNIFSSKFTIECADPERGLVYRQEWTENMKHAGKPSIRKKKLSTGYTKVSWIPDFEYFKIQGYDTDIIDIIRKHVYETAMITGLKVYLNKTRVPIQQFKDYPKLFLDASFPEREVLVIQPDDKLSIGLCPSKDGFEQISFVNGIYTANGGVHVDTCVNAIFKPLLKIIQTKRGISSKLGMRDLKSHFMIFINCWVPKPKFSDQTKNRLTFPKLNISIDEKDWKPLLRWSFIERLKEQNESIQQDKLQKTERSRGYLSIDKYERANKEGGKYSRRCSLILCEGDSAKTYAMTGIQNGVEFGRDIGNVKGKDWFGVYALKGKCFSKGTLIQMADGSKRRIEDIANGEKVMGDDYTPRSVQGRINGKDTLYRIHQSNGIDYDVTSDHILVLKLLHKSTIAWDNRRLGWIATYFDMVNFAIRTEFIACLVHPDQKYIKLGRHKPMTREEGFKHAQRIVRTRGSESSIVHMFVHDYMRLVPSVQNLLFGFRSIITPTGAKKHIYSTIKISKLCLDEFYGLRIDGNHRFLLSDGTVVHNCLNVRGASKTSIANNKEITNLIQILGLKYGVDYSLDDNYNTLRYGRVLVLADQDHDGLHILGLVMNIFHYLFPSLMKRKDFLYSMMTPIMKIGMNKQVYRFYNLEEAREFIQKHSKHKLEIKYFKGLGTSNDRDIKETFGKKVIHYIDTDKATPEMKLVFDKKMVERRKEWLQNPQSPPPLEEINSSVYGRKLSDFLRTELIAFSLYDCARSIPSVYDGLKTSQRKILYACFLRGMTSDTSIKVAQLSGYVSEKTDYHHGEQSLNEAITKMAQDFVGSNNIPLLLKDGQVGTRLMLGKDAASPRYVFVKLGTQTRSLFPKIDESILEYHEEDGVKVEPIYFVPILPMLLVNGGEGIGTAWSTSIPCYNPLDLKKWIKAWLNGTETPELVPWYSGFKGTIERNSKDKFTTFGVLNQTKPMHFVVTEIPIGMSIDGFKEICDSLMVEKKIKSFRNNSTPTDIHFEIVENNSGFQCTIDSLKLKSTIHTTNLVAFGEDNLLTKFNCVEEMLEVYCRKRIQVYTQQKHFMQRKLEQEHNTLFYKLKFIQSVMDGKLVVFKRPEESIIKELERKQFPKIDDKYTYLLDIPVRQFTQQKIEQLMKKLQDVETDIEYWKKTSEKRLWLNDLRQIE